MSLKKKADAKVHTTSAARRETTRSTILQSVTRIIAEEGADALTIDEVAKSAAMSKGGVLHHFPSKEALLLAAIRHVLDLFDETVDRLQRSDPARPGAYARAYLRACAESFGQPSGERLAFLHQFRSIPSTVELVRAYKERWRQRIEDDGLAPATAHLVRYTSHGIWLAATAAEKKPESFETMIDCLLHMAGADGGCCCGSSGSVRAEPRR